MGEGPYEVLGLAPSATDDQVRAAYVGLAQKFHPDQHPDASSAERAAWQLAMARVTDAYNDVKAVRAQAVQETTYRQSGSNPPPPPPPPPSPPTDTPSTRAPLSDECEMCGSTPAAPARYVQQVGKVFFATKYTLDRTLCRDCSLALGREYQNRTLILGWWGIVSFFRNFGYVTVNARELSQAKEDTRTKVRRPNVDVPLSKPLDPSPGLGHRFGIWFALAVVGVIAAVTYSAVTADKNDTSGGGGSVPSAHWAVGYCVTGTSFRTPTPCTAPHSGRIIAIVDRESACPIAYDSFAEDQSPHKVYCIDDDL